MPAERVDSSAAVRRSRLTKAVAVSSDSSGKLSRELPRDVSGPVRMCVGCRRRAAREKLLRVVVRDRGAGPELVPDPDREAPGRGASLHPTRECLELALRRRAFPRALRAPGGVRTTELEDYVERVARPA